VANQANVRRAQGVNRGVCAVRPAVVDHDDLDADVILPKN
jgi:hypothetical protein